jgi:hypothetical protein
LIKASASVLAF